MRKGKHGKETPKARETQMFYLAMVCEAGRTEHLFGTHDNPKTQKLRVEVPHLLADNQLSHINVEVGLEGCEDSFDSLAMNGYARKVLDPDTSIFIAEISNFGGMFSLTPMSYLKRIQ